MAKAPNERTERDFQLDVNAAVANTESEVFSDALGDEPLEEDGDTSLEDMGEGLEGDDLEEEGGDDEGQDAKGEDGAASEEEGEAEETPQGKGNEAAEPIPQDRRDIPLRQERERRRAAEERALALERQIAETNGRLTELSNRFNAPARPAAVEQEIKKPDQFADPEGYERWVMAEAEKKAEAKIEQRFSAFQQQQQQEREARLNDNFSAASAGQRGFEFQAAYRALVSLDPRDSQSRQTVQRIINSPDPSAALFMVRWNGADDFRQSVAEQLGLVPAQQRQGQRSGNRAQSQQPRHVTKLPPSLNTAPGGQRQQVNDPEMLDDSDNSVFSFATRR